MTQLTFEQQLKLAETKLADAAEIDNIREANKMKFPYPRFIERKKISIILLPLTVHSITGI